MSSRPSRSDLRGLDEAQRHATTRILDAVEARGRVNPVVVIDGPSGAGKTTLAARLVSRWPGSVQLVALDSLYPGWDGLAAGADIARESVLEPHAAGVVGVWRRWDWDAGAPAEAHEVDAALPLIVEGSGSLTTASAALADVSVWVDAPTASRRRRALERDGETYRPHWERWAEQERRHIACNDPAALANLRFTME